MRLGLSRIFGCDGLRALCRSTWIVVEWSLEIRPRVPLLGASPERTRLIAIVLDATSSAMVVGSAPRALPPPEGFARECERWRFAQQAARLCLIGGCNLVASACGVERLRTTMGIAAQLGAVVQWHMFHVQRNLRKMLAELPEGVALRSLL